MNFPTSLDENVIAAIAGILVFITVIIFAQALLPQDPMAGRLRSHKKRRDALRGEMLGGGAVNNARRAAQISWVKGWLDKLKLLRGEEARKTSEQLSQAGWRSRDALVIYVGLRLAMPFIGGIVTFVLLWVLWPDVPAMKKLMILLLGVIGIGFSPVFGLKQAIKKRAKNLTKQLPDALDLLVICTEAGLSLDAAITRVGREMGFAAPHLADELGLTAVELGFLPNRRQALMNLAKRTNLPAIRGVTNTLIQTERYGTPLAHSLRVLSTEFREERMLKAEEKAHKLPAILTVPMIVFILPCLFVVLLGPAIIQVVATFGTGGK
ncbi:MAG TPA: type II secretion system F family protein [Stellaceae bacterium]|nr:type II secretion system F family protein [Stellaceae bacterium]